MEHSNILMENFVENLVGLTIRLTNRKVVMFFTIKRRDYHL